ncbi:MAG: FAS1-like dehydratase domain-containing protein [Acidimicrobiales bacterium]
MAERIEIADDMSAAIGVESEPWTYEVTTTGVRSFARGVGYTDPVYFDVDAARTAGYDNLPAPPCYVGTPVFVPGAVDDRFSTPRRSSPRPSLGLENVLDGGTETVYERSVVAGDVLTGSSAIANLEVKESAALGAMLIVTTESTYRDRHGAVVARQRSQAIFY